MLGCDCRPLRLTRIFHIMSAQNCPALAERPKVFFIQVTALLGRNSIPSRRLRRHSSCCNCRLCYPGAAHRCALSLMLLLILRSPLPGWQRFPRAPRAPPQLSPSFSFPGKVTLLASASLPDATEVSMSC